jgi:uncharacterized protein YjiS (DUF1127 family)
LSPIPDRTPREVKALMSLAEAIRDDVRVRRAEAELARVNPRLLTDIGLNAGAVATALRARVVN